MPDNHVLTAQVCAARTRVRNPDRAVSDRADMGKASLDCLRFVAAVFIVVYHFASSLKTFLPPLPSLLNQGWMATDFFILLSGYVLSRIYPGPSVQGRASQGQVTFGAFMGKRLLRIWPLHAVVMLIFLLNVTLANLTSGQPVLSGAWSLRAWFAQFFLIDVLTQPSLAWNFPVWTLSALLICYAFYYVYAGLITKRSPWALLFLAVALGFVAQALSWFWLQKSVVDLHKEWRLWRALPLFVIGTLVSEANRRLNIGPRDYFLWITGLLTGAGVLASLQRSLVGDCLILMALVLSVALSGRVRLRQTGLTRKLGQASYALFVSHGLIVGIWVSHIEFIVGFVGSGMAASLLGVVFAVTFALCLEAYVDRPIQAWLRRFVIPARRASHVAMPAASPAD